MSASEEPSFTVELHGNDFLLHTGIQSHRLTEEIIEKISKCKGEYLPSRKGFVVPHTELCNLLDECFDYFTEESLMEIATLVESTTTDQTTKERVREKSVSKSKVSKKKKEEVKLDTIREEKPSKTKTRELEEKLLSLEKQRDAERREEKQREEKRRGDGRLKASPVRFRAPEPIFMQRPQKSIHFESAREDQRREVMTMMSHLRTGMKEMNANMSRLEEMISRNF